MRIDRLLSETDEPLFSFEFFPPKTDAGEENLHRALGELRALEPDYVSVTYGAGGSTRERTIDIVSQIRAQHGMEAMAHRLPHGQYLYLPNGSHMAMYDDQQAYFAGVIRFLRGVERGAAAAPSRP